MCALARHWFIFYLPLKFVSTHLNTHNFASGHSIYKHRWTKSLSILALICFSPVIACVDWLSVPTGEGTKEDSFLLHPKTIVEAVKAGVHVNLSGNFTKLKEGLNEKKHFATPPDS